MKFIKVQPFVCLNARFCCSVTSSSLDIPSICFGNVGANSLALLRRALLPSLSVARRIRASTSGPLRIGCPPII